VCLGIALAGSDVPTDLVGRCGLGSIEHVRGGRPEYRFFYRASRPRLPIWRGGRMQVVRWGNGNGRSRLLPRTGWTWLKTVQEGGWDHARAELVEIPATYGFERRGVWYAIETGVRGVLVPDEYGFAVCYMICQEATHYYRVMTGGTRMPVLIDQWI
jgi:hypothetical protein